jgi:molybdopterin synthase catalytic subunit
MPNTNPVLPAPPIVVQLLEAPFQPLERLAAWQRDRAESAAESHFIGRVRPTTAAGEPLEALELEHYPGMTEAQLQALAEAAAARHGAGAVLVAHRVGRVRPGEAIVLVAVQADRRGPALRCVQELLEDLKHHAPFWKREWSGGRGTWVAGNTPL